MLSLPFVTDNRVINGDFVIDQVNEFAASTPAASAYVADMWKFNTTGLGSAFTFQIQSTNSLRQFPNAMQITVASSSTPTAAQFATLEHYIEGSNIQDFALGTASAEGIVISFYVASNFSVVATFSAFLRNSANNRSYPFTFTTNSNNTGLFNQVSVLIPGDLTGTWLKTNGNIGLSLGIDLGSGSNFQGSANAWTGSQKTEVTGSTQLIATASAKLIIANVVVKKGPILDQQVYFPRSYPTELALCQRFYEKTFPVGIAPAQNAGVTGAITVKNPIALGDPSELWQFKVTKAKTPAITAYNPLAANANWRDITASSDVTVSIDPGATVGPNSVHIATSGTVTTLGDILAIHAVADARL